MQSENTITAKLFAAPDSDAPEALEALLRGRWSCRAFLPEEVPQETIERMLEIAQLSPSWCNTQPWQLHITSGDATERFREALLGHLAATGHYSRPDYAMPENYSGAHLERRRVSGWQLYDAVGIEKGDREASARQAAKNIEFFGAPHVAILTAPKELADYGAVDAGLYLGTLMLAARSLGIAAIAQAAIANFAPFIREYFDIDRTQNVLVAFSFGHEDREDPANSYRTERATLDEVVEFHTE